MLTLDSVISTFKYCFKQGRQAECGHEKRVGKRSADTSWRHKEHSRRTPSDEPSTEVLPVPAPAPAPPETLPQLLAVAPGSDEHDSALAVPRDPTEPLRLPMRLLLLVVVCRLIELQLVVSPVPSVKTPKESASRSGSMVNL